MTTRAETGLVIPCGGTWRNGATTTGDPLPARTTTESDGLALPPFVTQFRDRPRHLDPTTEPLNTVVADGANHALVQPPFIAELRGGGSGTRPATDPLATVTASGNHHALITSYYSTRGATTPVSQVMGTVTTVARHALLMRNNGVTGGHPARHTTPVREPMRTVTTAGHQSLLSSAAEYPGAIDIDDVLFRMLQPHEIGRAMAFARNYVVVGNKRQRVRQYGNAVTPPVAEVIVSALVEAITGETIERWPAAMAA